MSVLHVPQGSKGQAPAVIIGHSGSDGTIAWAWPERDLMVLLFTQSRGGAAVLRFEEPLDRLLIAPHLYAGEYDVPPSLEAFVGTYVADWANHMREEFVVHAKGGRLKLDQPCQFDFELVPANKPEHWKFAMAAGVEVWFERDAEGQVNCLRIQQGSQVFEAARKGTPHDAELRARQRAALEGLEALQGLYSDPESEQRARVLIDGDYLALKRGSGELLHLWKAPEPNAWAVRENQFMGLSFEFEGERAAALTLRSALGGTWRFVRVD